MFGSHIWNSKNNFGNFGTGRVTEKLKVSLEADGRADFKYGLCFNFHLLQTNPKAKVSFFAPFGTSKATKYFEVSTDLLHCTDFIYYT